ncbi:hypothetical protein [Burkholderia stagnalis]|uniref:hypothetical protein n=1 Tax=Burkholderia stagnalis TaxID=1503054 RepID=UPI0012DAA55A|nr:hypothetical protein [Burkholderia stagnalis]
MSTIMPPTTWCTNTQRCGTGQAGLCTDDKRNDALAKPRNGQKVSSSGHRCIHAAKPRAAAASARPRIAMPTTPPSDIGMTCHAARMSRRNMGAFLIQPSFCHTPLDGERASAIRIAIAR